MYDQAVVGLLAMGNLDFGTDWGNSAVNNYKNGHYILGTMQLVNGTIAAQSSFDYGTEYFSTDLLGSVRSATDLYGTAEASYTYDVFGSLVQGVLAGSTDLGYLGKQKDSVADLYNYGYRDYYSQTARFTTVDPIRDGTNWFIYCNGDPVNFIDFFGLEATDPKVYGRIDSKVDNYTDSQKKVLFDLIRGATKQEPLDIINKFNSTHPDTPIDENTLCELFADPDKSNALLMQREELHNSKHTIIIPINNN